MIPRRAATSQWGSRLAEGSGSSPSVRTTRLSSAVRPSGTDSCGKLGSWTRISESSWSICPMRSVAAFTFSLKVATLAFSCSAACCCPCRMSVPISLEAWLILAWRVSASACNARRAWSRSTTWAMASRASTPLRARASTTAWLFCLIRFRVSIVLRNSLGLGTRFQ